MSPTCDYSEVDDTSPCSGVVTLIEDTDAASGDRVALQACEGHRGMVNSHDPVEAPVTPWEDVPDSFFDDGL